MDQEAATPDERWKMSTVPANLHEVGFHLLTSPDGVAWRSRLNGSGPLLDRSTFWYDSFRRKWVSSWPESSNMGACGKGWGGEAII